MDTKDVLFELRTKKGLSQDELAGMVFVTRQAVSRWENGETTPNTETLKLLSGIFDVSINTLLGVPRQLVCQCCGMPLEDSNISRETDGEFNESYCKWCYADGKYTYDKMDELIDFCVGHMSKEQFTSDQVRAYMQQLLPRLNYWKRYAQFGGQEQFDAFKKQIAAELNDLHIDGLPEVKDLHIVSGRPVNHKFRLPSGEWVKLLDDEVNYLGGQVECEFGGSRCFCFVADMCFLLVYTQEADGEAPELVIYKKR